jgi:hypothetical protein
MFVSVIWAPGIEDPEVSETVPSTELVMTWVYPQVTAKTRTIVSLILRLIGT